MKKFITKAAMVAAFAVVAGYGVYASQKQEVTLSDNALANVEALAGGEVIVGQPCVSIRNNTCMYYYPWEVWEEDGAFYN